MKHFFILFSVLCFVLPCFSQSLVRTPANGGKKPVIDSAAVNHWVSLGDGPAISNDGNYFMYNIVNQPLGRSSLIVQSLTGSWKRTFTDGISGFFSKNSRQFFFKRDDTLFWVNLGIDLPDKKMVVNSYKENSSKTGGWLACILKNAENRLVLYNLLSADEQRFDGVADYSFGDDGNSMLLKTISIKDSNIAESLQLIDLPSGRRTTIGVLESTLNMGDDIINYTMDAAGKQVVYMVQEKRKDQSAKIIWYYREGMSTANKLADNQSIGNSTGLSVAGSELKFSEDGRYILFQLQGPETGKPQPGAISLDIWSYSDTLLQGTQLYQTAPKTYEAVINVDSSSVIQLTHDYEWVNAMPVKGDFAVVNRNDRGDRFWLPLRDSNWLISMRDGSRRSLPFEKSMDFLYSPDGRYLVYYAFKNVGGYYSMNMATGNIQKISGSIPTFLNVKDKFVSDIKIFGKVGIAGWMSNGNLLVYDNYDIWQLDPAGNKPAINITHGYGLMHHTKLRVVAGVDGTNDCVGTKNGKCMLLMAFNTANKYNGFYEQPFGRHTGPELLTMGPWTFDHQGESVLPVNSNEFTEGMPPIKARDENLWIVRRHTATEAPNYFATSDFKNYHALSNLQPQAEYNWLTSELVSWTQLDGTVSQGVLYKPEDFDPTKHYPVLITYYEQLSHRVYEYPIPEYTTSSINIPWFVSRGYLIFTPDIYYMKGKPGASIYNSVESAALFLSKLPYVDSRHMGINGHSTGGFETNYLVTHSNLFAAAVEGAGTSDWISSSLELSGVQGTSRGSRLEGYEHIMGATLWERPDLYRDNSPVLLADKVTTPLLIFHSKDDTAVPWEQGMELFIALRRLGKKVWMLQYDDQNHGNDGKAAEDFTIRITQFFDHYLKGMPVPRWMSKGIPARLKGMVTGFESDEGSMHP